MKNKLFAVLGTLILLTILYAPSVAAFDLGAQAEYWIPTFDGDVRVDNNGIVGTEVDLKDDLGVDNENFPGVKAYFGIGNHEITLAYSRIEFSGAKRINRNIIFNGDEYIRHSYVESNLNTNMIDFEYQYKFLNLENILAGFSLGLIGKIKYLDGDVSMRSSAHDNKENIRVPVPMIGLGVNIGILADILEARAKLVGFGYDDDVSYEAMADISLTPFPFLDIHGGYRIMSIKIDDVNDLSTKMDFYGPYAGLSISF